MAFSHPVQVRFCDLDALGHVNHAVFVSYLEVARTAWWQAFLAQRPFQEAGFLIARVEVDYRKPVALEDRLTVTLAVTQIGQSSFTLTYAVRRDSDGVVVAEAQTVQVCYDFKRQRPEPVNRTCMAFLQEYA